MELVRASKGEVVFSALYPPAFLTLTDVRGSNEDLRLCATCGDDDRAAVREVEAILLADLRECSRRTFAQFKDEFDSMFETAAVDRGVSMRLDEPLESALACDGTGAPTVRGDVDVTATPTTVTIEPGIVHVSWTVATVDAPVRDDNAPIAMRANTAIGRASRARRTIERLENSVRSDAAEADRALAFLEKHGFLASDDEESA